jgi:hypothetical protein
MLRTTSIVACAGCLGVLLGASLASAQFVGRAAAGLGGGRAVGRGVVGYGVGYGMGRAYGWWPGVNYGGATTAAGSYAQGMSQVIRAQGEYNAYTAKAAIDYQEAQSKYIENREKWTETYFQMKEQNQARQAEKAARLKTSSESLAAAAKAAAPKPLSPDALDPINGTIEWPDVLRDSQYAKPRDELDRLFELRAKTSGGADTTAKIRVACHEMQDILKSNITKVSANEFMAARKFVESLEYEAVVRG